MILKSSQDETSYNNLYSPEHIKVQHFDGDQETQGAQMVAQVEIPTGEQK